MMMNDLTIDAFTVNRNNSVVLRIAGNLNSQNFRLLNDHVQHLFNQNRFNIILDLSGVDFIASSAMGLFISSVTQAVQKGGRIILVKPGDKVRMIFDLFGITDSFCILPSIKEAISAMGVTPTLNIASSDVETRIAFHEAGHAAIGLELGAEVTGIYIEPKEDGSFGGRTEASYSKTRNEIIGLMSGQIAEDLFGPKMPNLTVSDSAIDMEMSDRGHAEQLAREVCTSESQVENVVSQSERKARELLAQEDIANCVKAMAYKLLELRSVSGVELTQLYLQYKRPAVAR